MQNKKSTLTFHGGAGKVTGANFLLDTGGAKILIDCGLVQGGQYNELPNYQPFPYDPREIDTLIVTHAHADHIGRIPKLVKDGFRGAIFSTPATRELAEVMYADALGILRLEAHELGRDVLYDEHDIEAAFELWQTAEYKKPFALKDDITCEFLDAGHILGSAMAMFRRNGKTLVATGDLGNSPAPLLRDTAQIPPCDYLITESVYGNRAHEHRDERTALLQEALIDTYNKGRTLLIPSFAMDRTQILLYLINNLVEDGAVPEMPVYLDSPLASKVTDIYGRNTELFNDAVQQEIRDGDDIFLFPQFVIVGGSDESHAILNAKSPKVIIAGSGMSVGGRVLMHEKRLLGDKNTTILFVGYQGVGTLGRRIQDGNKKVRIHGRDVRVRARVATIHGFSAHKDMNGIVDFVEPAADTLKKVFVTMGEPKSALFLTQRLRDFLGVDAIAPESGEVQELQF